VTQVVLFQVHHDEHASSESEDMDQEISDALAYHSVGTAESLQKHISSSGNVIYRETTHRSNAKYVKKDLFL